MRKSQARNLVQAALLAAVTAVLSQIQLSIGPVPFNLAVLGAYLAGMLMTPGWAVISLTVYMAMGLVGVPVFAGMMAGPAALFGKTGGYVIGYIAIAGVTVAARRLDKPVVTALGMAVGLLLCYGFGTAWFMVVTGTTLVQSLAWCVTPFILPDICKAACAYVLGRLLQQRMAQAGLLQ